jgi:uncharacterized membrane protein YvbJ
MNLCIYCGHENKKDETVCINCGCELISKISSVHDYIKLIGKLKQQITSMKKNNYYAYSNWIE